MHTKAYRIYNKCAKNIKESIHVIFDESNDGALSDYASQNLNLHKQSNDEEEVPKEVNSNKQPQEVPLNSEDTPSHEKEEATNEENSSLGGSQQEVTHRHYKYKPYHSMDNLLTDISSRVRTRSSLHSFCTFFAFITHRTKESSRST